MNNLRYANFDATDEGEGIASYEQEGRPDDVCQIFTRLVVPHPSMRKSSVSQMVT
jgi:hypothetical protein